MQFQVDAQEWLATLNTAKVLRSQDLTEKQRGGLLLLEGISYYRLGQEKSALNSLSKAIAIDSATSQAKGWLNYIGQMKQG